ncbi:MAG: hypothetical protein ABL921_21510 [Pirellula sp.]
MNHLTALKTNSSPKIKSPRHRVQRFLKDYSKRNATIQCLRGLCSLVALLFLLISLVMIVDALRWISDEWRWIVVSCCYLGAVIVGWYCGIKSAWLPVSRMDAANNIESARPAFRESLISSIELRADDGSIPHGSPAFVRRIEQDVAHELGYLDIRDLLPWTAASRWLGLCCLLWTGLLMLHVLFPNWSLPARFARATIPFVDIERPTHIRLVVVEPLSNALSVPSGQTIRFVVEVLGGSATEAILELHQDSQTGRPSPGETRSLKMMPEGKEPLRFSISASVGEEPTRFRMVAGDGRTPFYTITPILRPKPLKFNAVIIPPTYSKLESSKHTSLRGDMKLLAGSTVHLEVETNTKLEHGAILIDREGLDSREKLDMAPVSKSQPETDSSASQPVSPRYQVAFPVDEDLRYQLKLVSNSYTSPPRKQATDSYTSPPRKQVTDLAYQSIPIENSYSPQYRVEARLDNAPHVAWVDSEDTLWRTIPQNNENFIVAPGEVITLSASLSDEMPVDQCHQEISINQGAWHHVPVQIRWNSSEIQRPSNQDDGIDTQTRYEARSSWKWDLGSTKVQSGDILAVRLVALDRIGNQTVSSEIRLNVAHSNLDRDRHRSLYQRSDLVRTLRALADELGNNHERFLLLLERVRKSDTLGKTKSNPISEIRDLSQSLEARAQAVRSRGLETMMHLARCANQSELELILWSIASIEKELMSELAHRCSTISEPSLANDDLEKAIQGMTATYDKASTHSKKTLEIYLQFVGAEFQAALTMELTGLRDHWKDTLFRNPDTTFEALVRSHQIAELFLESATKLSDDMQNNIPSSVRPRLDELHRWIDRIRMETGELVQATETPQLLEQLRNRMERSMNELRTMRSGIGGAGFIWSTIDGRKELLKMSGLLSTRLDATIKQWNSIQATKDNSGDSPSSQVEKLRGFLAEIVGPRSAAIEQLLIRRDVHQRRLISDSMYTHDTGMAFRAWTSVLERCMSDTGVAATSDAALHLGQLREIAAAFRILESYHETADAKIALESLRSLEQYEWNSLNGQLFHVQQWDGVIHRVESALTWMQQTILAADIAGRFTALRNSEIVQVIAKKLNARKDPNNQYEASAADEIQELLTQWYQADAHAKPLLDAAREVLTKYAPSVSELANIASVATRELRSLNEEIQSSIDITKPLSSIDAKELARQTASMQRKQLKAAARTSQLQDALIELAHKQDLLSDTERGISKDSDNALRLIDATTWPMTQSIALAMNSIDALLEPDRNPADTVGQPLPSSLSDIHDNLGEAARLELAVVNSLDEIAKHFARTDAPNDSNTITDDKSAPSRAALQQIAEQATEQLDENSDSIPLSDQSEEYAEAERLAALAETDPSELLNQLEKELKSNEAMQDELSNISLANAASIAAELRNAAEGERSIDNQIENSDPVNVGEKRVLMDQMRLLSDQVDRITSRAIARASQISGRQVRTLESAMLGDVAAQLRAAASAAKQLTEQTAISEIQSRMDDLAKQLTESQQKIAQELASMKPLTDRYSAKDEQHRQNIRSEMRNLQNQIRDDIQKQSRDIVQEARVRLNQAKAREEQHSSQLSKLERQLAATQLNAQQFPSDRKARNRVLVAIAEAEQAMARKLASERILKNAVSMEQLADTHRRNLEAMDKADVDRPNPFAAAESEQLNIANDQIAEWIERANLIRTELSRWQAARASSASLAAQKPRQLEVQETVSQGSSSLARSARHEQRLGNNAGAETLFQIVRRIEQASTQSIAPIANQISNAEAETLQQEEIQKQRVLSANLESPFQRPSTRPLQDRLANAAQILSGLAVQLEESVGLAAKKNEQAIRNDSAQTPSQPESDRVESRNKARLLDELDRELNDGSNNSQQQQAGSKKDDSPQGTSSGRENTSSNKNSSDSDQDDRSGTGRPFKDSVRQSAKRLSGGMNQDRLNQKTAMQEKQANARKDLDVSQAQQSGRGMAQTQAGPQANSFMLPGRSDELLQEWGKLRTQRAEDVIEGKREVYDPEFAEAIKAYYRSMGTK